jgi:hypothetical protein
MTTTLTDQNISDTYKGILHAQGTQIAASTQVLIYDGEGNATSLRVGRSGEGVTISGVMSSSSLIVNGIIYPTTDGSAGNLLQTDGAGTLSFSPFLSSTLPTLTPSPANTYQSISSISVDSKGRVTQITTAAGGVNTSQSIYASPILLLDTTNNHSGTLDAARSNMPADTTYALIKVVSAARKEHSSNTWVEVALNGEIVSTLFPKNVSSSVDTISLGSVGMWPVKLDGSNLFTIDITSLNMQYQRHKIYLIGYANFNTLSNP